MIRRKNIVWDDQKHSTVHLGMTNHNETDAAYLRKCVEFYEMNKAGATGMQLVLERLTRLETLLKRGVVIGAGDDPAPEDHTDDIFDELLEQMK